MKKLISTLLLIIGAFSACGGGESGQPSPNPGQTCDFQISSLVNGQNSKDISSVWACTEDGNPGLLLVLADGSGFSTGAGFFNWTQTGCRSVRYSGGAVSGEVTNLNGNISSGTLTAQDTYNNKTHSASCSLVRFAPIQDISGTYNLTSNIWPGCNGLFDSQVAVSQNGTVLDIKATHAGFNDAQGEIRDRYLIASGPNFRCFGIYGNDLINVGCTVDTLPIQTVCGLIYQKE